MADVRAALEIFGEETYYGVKVIELVPSPLSDEQLPLGRLVEPGRIVLYDQAFSPWRLALPLPSKQQASLQAAGAVFDGQGVIAWPGDTLRRFMVHHVLTHELGHHVIQHERRLRNERGTRAREHEVRADAIATRLRALLK